MNKLSLLFFALLVGVLTPRGAQVSKSAARLEYLGSKVSEFLRRNAFEDKIYLEPDRRLDTYVDLTVTMGWKFDPDFWLLAYLSARTKPFLKMVDYCGTSQLSTTFTQASILSSHPRLADPKMTVDFLETLKRKGIAFPAEPWFYFDHHDPKKLYPLFDFLVQNGFQKAQVEALILKMDPLPSTACMIWAFERSHIQPKLVADNPIIFKDDSSGNLARALKSLGFDFTQLKNLYPLPLRAYLVAMESFSKARQDLPLPIMASYWDGQGYRKVVALLNSSLAISEGQRAELVNLRANYEKSAKA